MVSKSAMTLSMVAMVMASQLSGSAVATTTRTLNQDLSAQMRDPNFENKYCRDHANEKACQNWCKQHPKKDGCANFLKKTCDKHPNKDFCPGFEKYFCKNNGGNDKFCNTWCEEHPKNDACGDYIKKTCERHPDKDFCTSYLKETCPSHSDQKYCRSFCKEHPHKCGKPSHDECVRGGFGATNSVRSTDGSSAPSQGQAEAAFQSIEASEESSSGGQLGAQRNPPGTLPMKDLGPLLEQLGVHLSNHDLKIVKEKLNDGGYFTLPSFFVWWSEYMICNAIFG